MENDIGNPWGLKEETFSPTIQEKLARVIVTPEFSSIVSELLSGNSMIAIPDGKDVTVDFVKFHSFIRNPMNENQIVSLKGCQALLNNGQLEVLDHPEVDIKNMTWNDINAKKIQQIPIISNHMYITVWGNKIPLWILQEPIASLSSAPNLEQVVEKKQEKAPITPSIDFKALNPLPPLKVIDPSIVVDGTKNVIQALSSISFIPTELPLPPCKDPQFDELVSFLKQPTAKNLCLELQKYTNEIMNLSTPMAKDCKLDVVAQTITNCTHDFKNKLDLPSPGAHPKDDSHRTVLLDGLESYLIAISYDTICKRHMTREREEDLAFLRKIMLLNGEGKIHQSLGIERDFELSGVIASSAISLIRFEQAITPPEKLVHLGILFDRLSDDLFSKKNRVGDADQLLCLVAFILLMCPCPTLVSSLRFAQKLHSKLTGKEAYVIVTMEAAISFIFNYEVNTRLFPEDVLDLVKPVKTKKATTERFRHGTVVDDIQKAAKDFSTNFWNIGKFTKKQPVAL